MVMCIFYFRARRATPFLLFARRRSFGLEEPNAPLTDTVVPTQGRLTVKSAAHLSLFGAFQCGWRERAPEELAGAARG